MSVAAPIVELTPTTAPARRLPVMWPIWLVLAAVVALGIVPRCAGLGTRSLWFDEAFCWRVAQAPVGEVIARSASDNSPPLYFLTLKAWMAVFGESSVAIRALSVLSGAVAIVGAFLLVRAGIDVQAVEAAERHGVRFVVRSRAEWTAVFAAALVAVSVFQVRWGWEARMYALGTALAALSSWAMFRALAEPHRPTRAWLIYGWLALAFAYTHVYALFSLVAQGVFIAGYLVFGVGKWQTKGGAVSATERRSYFTARSFYEAVRCACAARTTRLAALTGLAVAAGWAAWLPALAGQRSRIRADFWTEPVSRWDVPRVCHQMLVCPEDAEFDPPASIVAAIFCGLVLAALMLRPKPLDWYLLLAVNMPVLLSVLVSLVDTKIFHLRYFVFAGLFFCCALARVVSRMGDAFLRRIVAACLLVNAAYVCLTFVAGLHFNDRPGARGACDHIAAARERGEPVIVASPFFYLPVRYHLGDAADCFLLGRLAEVRHYEGSAALDDADFISQEAFQNLNPGRVWVVGNHSGGWPPRAPAAPAGWRAVSRRSFREAYGVQGTMEVVEYVVSGTGGRS